MEKGRFAGSYLITAPKRIHIYAEEIIIRTTPYFVQDGIVTSCAHASIVMMTQFLNLKYGYQKLHIKDMIQSYQNREKLFPTRGLLPEQVMEILMNNKFNVVKYELGRTSIGIQNWNMITLYQTAAGIIFLNMWNELQEKKFWFNF